MNNNATIEVYKVEVCESWDSNKSQDEIAKVQKMVDELLPFSIKINDELSSNDFAKNLNEHKEVLEAIIEKFSVRFGYEKLEGICFCDIEWRNIEMNKEEEIANTILINPNPSIVELALDEIKSRHQREKELEKQAEAEDEQCAFAFVVVAEGEVLEKTKEIYVESYPTEWYKDEGKNYLILYSKEGDYICDCIFSYVDRMIECELDLYRVKDKTELENFGNMIACMCEHLRNDKKIGDSICVTLSKKLDIKINITKVSIPKVSIVKTLENNGGICGIDNPRGISFYGKPLLSYFELKTDEVGE